ncbi:MAG: ATP-binding cassette domain-containing protein [Lentisphaeria bacterium]|nr:ATP-binding cassette domain-containing protein [Lentisphaeria bacterium]
MKDTPLLKFDNVSFSWKNATEPLLRNVTWTLKEGDAIHLDAPSGTGKTTFLKLAAGLLNPTAGSITIATDNIGFVFQEARLMPWLTVIDNIRLVQRKPNDAPLLEMLDFLGLAEKAPAMAGTLSGGEAQRVSLIRALANSPEILFLDEPFNGLDATLTEKSVFLINKWRNASDNRGFIIVSHIKKSLTDLNAKSLLFPKFS